MRTLVTALLLLALVGATAVAEDKKAATVDMRYLGVPVETALTDFARDAGLKLQITTEEADLDAPVWLCAKGVELGRGALLLAAASGLNVALEGETLTVRDIGARGGNRPVKGYDVSILCGRYVDYVNQYGSAERAQPAGEPRQKPTAAEVLRDLLVEHAQQFWGVALEGSVVGDRILFTTSAAVHARIREFLDLLMSETGGETAELQLERGHAQALAAKSGVTSFEEIPLGSVIANLCIEAGADFVVDGAAAGAFSEGHVSWTGEGKFSDQADELLAREAADVRVGSRLGVVYFGMAQDRPYGGARVFDVSQLLKKLELAYQRQRTKPGREEGFDESLSAAGGVRVIKEALDWQLFEQDFSDRVECYGSRVVVGGGPQSVDAAVTILKEMGWEEPAK